MPVDMTTLMADTAGEAMPSMLPVHRRGLRHRLGGQRRPAARTRGRQGRGGVQRHLLVHPRWVLDHGGASRSARLLGRGGGVGDPFGRGRQGHGRVDPRRRTRDRRPRMRSVPLRGTAPRAPNSSSRPVRRPSSRSTTSSIRTSTGTSPATCASARSISARLDLGAYFFEGGVLGTAGLVRGQRPADGRTVRRREWNSPNATTGPAGSSRRSRSPRPAGPASTSRSTT